MFVRTSRDNRARVRQRGQTQAAASVLSLRRERKSPLEIYDVDGWMTGMVDVRLRSSITRIDTKTDEEAKLGRRRDRLGSRCDYLAD